LFKKFHHSSFEQVKLSAPNSSYKYSVKLEVKWRELQCAIFHLKMPKNGLDGILIKLKFLHLYIWCNNIINLKAKKRKLICKSLEEGLNDSTGLARHLFKIDRSYDLEKWKRYNDTGDWWLQICYEGWELKENIIRGTYVDTWHKRTCRWK